MAENLPVDTLHMLQDFLDNYPNEKMSEIVVTESVANSLDEGATVIKITLEGGWYTIRDNGGGMDEEKFKKYHIIAVPSKTKGRGIGFAGIGAKIYLAALEGTEIMTDTNDGNSGRASRMFRQNNDLKYERVKSQMTDKGTKYSVKLKAEDYQDLEKTSGSMCLDGLITQYWIEMLNSW
jgi:hypothetical protein